LRTTDVLRRARMLCAVFCLVFMVSSCAPPEKGGDETAGGGGAAGGGRVLKVYSALDPNESKIYFKEYEEKTGVNIQWERMSSGAILARLMAEGGNPSMGLWFGGSSTDFIAAAEKGLLDVYKPETDFELQPRAHDPQWRWTGFYFGAIGFASNSERLKKIGAKAPRSWEDLMRPEFKGEIGMAYPYTSGTSYTVLSTLAQLMGEEKAFDYLRLLDGNIHHYNKSGSACVTQVGLGEITVGIAFSHDIVKKGPSRGYPVIMTFPKEGTGYEIGGMAVIRNGPGVEEARKFMDWVLSVEAQNLMQNWFRIPLNPRAEVVEGSVSADSLKMIVDDAQWSGKNKARLVERWRLITSR
jgi:iron(III) transport system substrate-binding protein